MTLFRRSVALSVGLSLASLVYAGRWDMWPIALWLAWPGGAHGAVALAIDRGHIIDTQGEQE